MHEVLDVHGKPAPCSLQWPEGLGAGVFLGKLRIDAAAIERLGLEPNTSELKLFGARRPCTTPPGSWRAEYLVDEQSTQGASRAHHLTQHGRSVFHTAPDDASTSAAVDMLKKEEMPCAGRRPRWKAGEASWPTSDGKPSLFLGQLYISETPTTKERFSWGEAVFVFASRTEGGLQLQIYSEDMTAQTAEDHYRIEGMIAEFGANFPDVTVLQPLITSGDRYFYEFLFEHPKLDDATLALIAQHGKTKAVRNRAAKELRRRASAR